MHCVVRWVRTIVGRERTCRPSGEAPLPEMKSNDGRLVYIRHSSFILFALVFRLIGRNRNESTDL